MRVVIEVPIKKPQGGLRFAHREVDLSFAPYVGMPVWDVAWKDSREVKGVSLDINDKPYLIVTLEAEEAGNADGQEQLIEEYEGHGWVVKSENP